MVEGQRSALETANDIITAFGNHEKDRYFSLFAPSATFLFYTSDRLLVGREEYRTEWESWESEGFRVLACASTDQRVDVVRDGVVVFTHHVHTNVHDSDGDHQLDERETIVLSREPSGQWLGVHEHLSSVQEQP